MKRFPPKKNRAADEIGRAVEERVKNDDYEEKTAHYKDRGPRSKGEWIFRICRAMANPCW